MNSIRQSTAALSEGFITNTTTIKFNFKHKVTFKLCAVILLANMQINFNHKKYTTFYVFRISETELHS